jgi:hypothetical protein
MRLTAAIAGCAPLAAPRSDLVEVLGDGEHTGTLPGCAVGGPGRTAGD